MKKSRIIAALILVAAVTVGVLVAVTANRSYELEDGAAA